jgi:hypothetical protein
MIYERANLQTHPLASSLFGDSCSSLRSTITVNAGAAATSSSSSNIVPPSTKTTRRRDRTVNFCSKVTVEETIHVNDFSDEEYYLYWITHNEQSVMMGMIDITTELMSIGASEDGEHICFRGLEGKTQQATQDYTDKYMDIVHAVMEEQQYRLQDGSVDHTRIAELYREWTKPCKEIALQRALMDRNEAQSYLSQQLDTTATGR